MLARREVQDRNLHILRSAVSNLNREENRPASGKELGKRMLEFAFGDVGSCQDFWRAARAACRKRPVPRLRAACSTPA